MYDFYYLKNNLELYFIYSMKRITLLCGLALISSFAFAQTIAVNGTIADQQGKPVPFAFIKDARHNYATLSDLNGTFNLKVDTADRLIISAKNFMGMVVKIVDPKDVSITMKNDVATGTKSAGSGEAFKEKSSTEGMTHGTSSGYIAHENTVHGSRYLFEDWVHGYAITTDDSIKQNNNYLFNYGKMDGTLVFTDDGKTMQTINRHSIKMFTLFDDQGQPYVFENVPAIDPIHFMQVLATGSKYKIYKQLGTKYIPNNYVSNGMTSSGNNYDEFKDESVYYAVKMPEGTIQKFSLKRKGIKTAFAADIAKVNKFESAHDSDEIDDKYLKALGDYINE
ncbi:MAG: hypothetical protein JWP37_377 [Mucilaginibacter sp.]|nr:hypothetical protein [Mucilaginibacter sp.]